MTPKTLIQHINTYRAVTLAVFLVLFGGAVAGSGWAIWLFFAHPTIGLFLLLILFFSAILTM
jgi:hypothetical protein